MHPSQWEMDPCVVRIFRMTKSAKLSDGPEHDALLLCEFQAQDINISLELERELARASLGPCFSSYPRARTSECSGAQTAVKPGGVWVSAALGTHLKWEQNPDHVVTSFRAAPSSSCEEELHLAFITQGPHKPHFPSPSCWSELGLFFPPSLPSLFSPSLPLFFFCFNWDIIYIWHWMKCTMC